MKKLLVIAPYNYLPWFSGGQKSIAQFLEHLGNETELTVGTVAENDFSLVRSYKHINLLKTKSRQRYTDRSLIRKIKEIISTEKIDMIIWEHPYFAWLASIIKKKTGIHTLVHSHNIEYQRFRSKGKWWWPLLKMYERWSFRLADHILFVAPEDKQFAVDQWKIPEKKCIEVAFGVEIREYPSDKTQCRKKISDIHGIAATDRIFLFNGLLDYKPNLDALIAILDQINPILLTNANFSYKIIICGKRLPKEMNDLKSYRDKNIIYAGFVDDIEMYFKGADLFLNPVQSGGGIKTKMVESIAFGTTVIATETGAAGIKKNICGNKLMVVADNDWTGFANAILRTGNEHAVTPPEYYDYYYWGSVVKKLVQTLSVE